MTDVADRTGITYVTHGKMIYFTVLRMHCDGADVGAALRSRGGAGWGNLSRERVQLVVWWLREAGECLPF